MSGPARTFWLLLGFARLRGRRRWQQAMSSEWGPFGVVLQAVFAIVIGVLVFSTARTAIRMAGAGAAAGGFAVSSAEGVVAMFLLLGGSLGLVSGIGRAHDALYLRSDLDWLMKLPLNRVGVMLAEVAGTALGVAGQVALVAAPAVLAYAVEFGAWHSIVLCPLFVAALAVFDATASVLLASSLGKLANSIRRREVLGLIGSITGAMLWVLLMTRSQAGPSHLVDSLAQGVGKALENPAAGVIAVLALPLTWPGLALFYLARGGTAPGVLLVLLGVSAAGGAAWLISAAGARSYVRGLGRVGFRAGPARRPPVARIGGASRRAVTRTGILGALVARDWAIATRNPRLWQAMAMPLAYAVFLLLRRPVGLVLTPGSLLPSGIGAGAAAMVAGPVAAMAFGIEGAAFYHLSVLPLPPITRVASKTVVFALPSALLGLVVAYAFLRPAGTPLEYIQASILVVTSAVAVTPLTLSLAVPQTDFESVTPGQSQPGSAGCMSMVVVLLVCSVGYGVLMAGRGIGIWLGLEAVAANLLGTLVLSGLSLGAFAPAVARGAADAVRARGRGQTVSTWGGE